MKLSFPVNAVLLLGPTGAGKSPLGGLISRLGLLGRRCHHLDFGSELRAVGAGGRRSGIFTDEELRFIQGVLTEGLLLENEHFAVAKKIIQSFLNRSGFGRNDLLVLNGIPRHVGQAADISMIADIHAVIALECTPEDIILRLTNNAGGDRTGRADDHIELVRKKMAIYQDRTAPLIGHYLGQGKKIYTIAVSADTTPMESYERLSALAAADPPVAFVAEPPER